MALGSVIAALNMAPGVKVRSEYSPQSDLTNVYVDRPDGTHSALALPRHDLQNEEHMRMAMAQLQQMVALPQALYGYTMLRNDLAPRRTYYHGFPRTVAKRIARMNRLIRWRRQKIRERHLIHVGLALGFLAAFPVVAAIIAKLWQLAIATILG